MKFKGHRLFAQYLIDTALPPLSPAHACAFRVGNLYPDRNYLTYLRGHTFDGAAKHIGRVCRRLEKKKRWNRYDWFRLGTLMHYLADSFTLAHSPLFRGSLHDHRAYEFKLHDEFSFFLEHFALGAHDNGMPLHAQLHARQAAYLNEAPSVEKDCFYIVSTCLLTISRILAGQTETRRRVPEVQKPRRVRRAIRRVLSKIRRKKQAA